MPSRANSQAQPGKPFTPLKCKIPYAKKALIIEVLWYATQKKLRRIGSSNLRPGQSCLRHLCNRKGPQVVENQLRIICMHSTLHQLTQYTSNSGIYERSQSAETAVVEGHHTYKILSGMNPPSIRPRRARHVQKPDLPFKKAWQQATKLHETICIGIQLSGPI